MSKTDDTKLIVDYIDMAINNLQNGYQGEAKDDIYFSERIIKLYF